MTNTLEPNDVVLILMRLYCYFYEIALRFLSKEFFNFFLVRAGVWKKKYVKIYLFFFYIKNCEIISIQLFRIIEMVL